VWPPERPCMTPEGYFQYAAGISCVNLAKLIAAYKGDDHPLVLQLNVATIQGKSAEKARERDEQDQANQRPVGTNQHSEPLYNQGSVIQAQAPSGTSVEAALRRLRKFRTDLHERVLAGELTPHAAYG
jgi:hypothetical protein